MPQNADSIVFNNIKTVDILKFAKQQATKTNLDKEQIEFVSHNTDIKTLEQYLGKGSIDIVVASTTKISQHIIDKYRRLEEKDPVIIDADKVKEMGIELIEENLLTIENGTIRHDSLKLSSLIISYLINKM